MYRCEVLTEWNTDYGMNRAQVVIDYPQGIWSDATGQSDTVIPTEPNMVVFEGVVDANTLTALEGDTHVIVLWSEAI